MANNDNTFLYGAGITLALVLFASSDKKKPQGGGGGGIVYKGTIDYVKKNIRAALDTQKRYGVPYLVPLTVSAVETEWGKHAPGNNHFGIKANKTWEGGYMKLKTKECGPTGNPQKDHVSAEIIQIIPPGGPGSFTSCNNLREYSYSVYSKFRSYPTPYESFLDFGDFLRDNSRYKGAFAYKDPEQFGAYVLTHGYSTAKYVPTFLKIMRGIDQIVRTKLS